MIEGSDLQLFERSIRQATSRLSGESLDAALLEVGWSDALASDPRTAISILFSFQGQDVTTSSALDRVAAFGLGLELAAGSAVVLPPIGSWALSASERDGRMRIRGAGTSASRRSDTLLVLAGRDGGAVRVASVHPAEVSVRKVDGMDPAYGLTEVSADGAPYSVVAEAGPQQWEQFLALARLAIGHELVGAGRGMLDLARLHALDRVQFGQPIARFQAVRHRLAETLVAIEAADGLLDATAELAGDGQGASPELAAVAKALAGRAARTAARHCQQVLAGIGFTAEHPFHRYLRRALVLDQLLGTSRSLTEDLGRQVLASRHLPDLLPL